MNELIRNSLLVLCALVLGFVALELGARLYQPNVRLLTLTNFIYDRVSLLRSGYPRSVRRRAWLHPSTRLLGYRQCLGHARYDR